MKIYALNGMQKHSKSVKKTVMLQGSVVLRGFAADHSIQLLEGPHRMAYAVELGLPINIVLFGENEIVPHDCDNVEKSAVTGLPDRCAAGELAPSLVKERGMYHQAVYESEDHPNIRIVEGGAAAHLRLTHGPGNPFGAFPSYTADTLYGLLRSYQRLLKKGGLLVMLDTHPCRNLFSGTELARRYDDLRPQNGKTYWRLSDFARWIPAAGLRFYAFLELHADYDAYDDTEAAVPRWLASFATK